MVDRMNHLLTITQARALARIRTANTDAELARKRELLAQAVRWYSRKMAIHAPHRSRKNEEKGI